MIYLKRLTGELILVNADLIRQVESTPDSVLTFLNGEKLVVLDTFEEIIKQVVEFRRRCQNIQNT